MPGLAKRGQPNRSRTVRCAAFAILALAVVGCARPSGEPPPQRKQHPKTLSVFGLFAGDGSTQEPVEGMIPYDLNTALFTDYAAKYRFVKFPPGTQAVYHETESFDFPVGTIIAKTFAFADDMTEPDSTERLLETRLLIHEEEGWVGLPYVWNEEQTEATLRLAGGTLDITWIHTDGSPRENNYIVPNSNQCKGCHQEHDKKMAPIGPKARHLNKDFAYAHGGENQLAYWTRTGALKGAPEPEEAPRLVVWDDESSGTLDQRARAYLEVNCAHCHNPTGPARNSGLDLLASQNEPYKYGVMKAPVAAGRGSGDLAYGIVPGKPDESILLYRMTSLDPDAMMPELGKRLVHTEGVELIREWIAAMDAPADQTVQ